MKRFHVHVAVGDLAANVAFYSKLFGQAPSKQRADYVKWMLEDPRLNFAISSRAHPVGVNHFGMQADSSEELCALKALADSASGGAALGQSEATCCYAKSEKHWIVDPQGLAWEHFMNLSDAATFGDDTATPASACCIPVHAAAATDPPGACCVAQETTAARAPCCT